MRNASVCFAFICAAALCASCAHYDTLPPGTAAKADEPADLRLLIDRGHTTGTGEYRIVDVRNPKKFAEGHIPTATNLPNGILEGVDDPPPNDKLIILYCETGGRAQAAAKKLSKAGYEHLYNWGGFDKWPFEAETSPLPEPVKKEKAERKKEEKKDKKEKKQEKKQDEEDDKAEESGGDSLEDMADTPEEPAPKGTGDELDGLF